MPTLTDTLKNESTADLQRKLRTNGLTTEAAQVAAQILRERGANVPAPLDDSAMEAQARRATKRSTAKFGAFIVWAAVAWMFRLDLPENHYWLIASAVPLLALLAFYRTR